jgi:crotonobetainyl-CoA:carnitine CoA-transferase CaiB-like acyl-CoA transferase
MGALDGVRVLELGRVYSGPLCGMALADLGADVIKVERPGVGDESRCFGVHYFHALNRGKRSAALDLELPADRDLFEALMGGADVMVHNWLQPSLDRLGYGWEAVHARHPRLVYCAISGYGRRTCSSGKPAQDIIAQALSGFMSLTGESGGGPLKSAIPVVDHATGLYAALGVVAALHRRHDTGRGELVATSLLETALAMTSFASAAWLSAGLPSTRTGNRHPAICPYDLYQARDGRLVLAVANDDMWARCRRALDLPPDARFATNALRLANREALDAVLVPRLAALSVVEVLAALEAEKVSCARLNELSEAFADGPVAELDCVLDLAAGVRVVGSPLKVGPADASTAPPALGQHTEALRASRGW